MCHQSHDEATVPTLLGAQVDGGDVAAEEVGDPIEARCDQLIYRWVTLPHLRPVARQELRDLIAFVKNHL
jgi:hypothetical protein